MPKERSARGRRPSELRSHEGRYIGFKLHVVANRKGRIVAFDLSQANRHDTRRNAVPVADVLRTLASVKGGLLDGLVVAVLAAAGYVSAQVSQDLMSKDIAFVAKPTSAMADMRWYFDRNWDKLYKQRQMVEGVFSRFKNRFGLLGPSCLSPTSLTVRVRASTGVYELQQPAS